MTEQNTKIARAVRGAVALAAMCGSLLAAPAAFATMVNTTSTDGTGKDLNTLLNSTWYVSGPTTDIQNGQLSPDEIWQTTSTSASINRLIFEFAGYAPSNTFGIYDVNDKNCTSATFASCTKLTIFSGSASSGAVAGLDESVPGTFSLFGGPSVAFSSSQFGYFLSGTGGTFFSQSLLNEFGTDHMVAYAGQGQTMKWPSGSNTVTKTWGPGETLLAWEDLPTTSAGGRPGDWDYNDMLVMVNSVKAVPEPGSLALFGAGLLAIGATLRRRKAVA